MLADIAAGLAARGHDVIVASFDAEGTEDFYQFAAPIRRVRLGIGQVRERSGFVEVVRRALALRSLARIEAPAVAIGFMHSTYVPLSLAFLGSGVPVVASEHIVYSHYWGRPLERLLLSVITPFVWAFTGISENVRRGFPNSIRRIMVVVPNPVRVVVTNRADVRGGITKVLLTVGRLEKQKDHATLIRAFSQLSDRFPDWTLRIVGEGSQRPVLESLIAQLGQRSKVILCGASTTIDTEYRNAQLFVIPSVYESFGLATAEALSYGLPAVGFSDCPGTNELIQDGVNGVLVRGQDRAESLALEMARLMGSPEERVRMGDAAPQLLASFSPDCVVERWLEVLDAAMCRKAPQF